MFWPLESIYVVVDEPTFMFTEFSEEKFDKSAKRAFSEVSMNDVDEYDASSLLRDLEESYDSINLTDIEILRCAARSRSNERPHDCLISRSPPTFTGENSDVNRQLDLLMKGFPEAKATRPVEIPFAETKNISSAGTSSRGGARKKNEDFKTGNDVREISGEEPTRAEGRLVEITNTWRDVKRALSLLCVKTFSSSAAMLEAPPGSREDLVEAARTPCTPTDLDTMLYGYTNSIYVLDHTPESLPDMDMLQLFASPAGRALVTGDNRPTTRGGSTSTSLSRESSSRAKSSRRASSTFGIPTPPPRQRKSSAELYKEAVEILGLTCSLTDSCRCLDCQIMSRQYQIHQIKQLLRLRRRLRGPEIGIGGGYTDTPGPRSVPSTHVLHTVAKRGASSVRDSAGEGANEREARNAKERKREKKSDGTCTRKDFAVGATSAAYSSTIAPAAAALRQGWQDRRRPSSPPTFRRRETFHRREQKDDRDAGGGPRCPGQETRQRETSGHVGARERRETGRKRRETSTTKRENRQPIETIVNVSTVNQSPQHRSIRGGWTRDELQQIRTPRNPRRPERPFPFVPIALRREVENISRRFFFLISLVPPRLARARARCCRRRVAVLHARARVLEAAARSRGKNRFNSR